MNRLLAGCAALLTLAACAAAQVEMLGDFEADADLEAWAGDTEGARVEATDQAVAVGERAGAFIYPGSDQPSWPMIGCAFDPPRDWSGHEFLAYHLRPDSERSAWFWLQVEDADGRYAQLGSNVAPSDGAWFVYLVGELAAEIDLSRVAEFRFMLARPKQEMRMTIDGLFVGDELEQVTGLRPMVRLAPERADAVGLEGALRETMLSLYGPGLVDEPTGLPYEFFSLTERRPMQDEHPVHRSIGGDDTTEQHTPYMLFAIATRDPAIVAIEQRLLDAFTTVLDPGDGLVGCYRWDYRDLTLGDFWGWMSDPQTGENYRLSDAEHGAEVPLYSLLPGAWALGHEEALASLEAYSRTMLAINSKPGCVHLHMYLGRDDDGALVGYDWDGEKRWSRVRSEDPAKTWADIMEFWWIMPMLGCAGSTEDATLRERIIARVEPIMANVARHQREDGLVANTYRMDGAEADTRAPGYMYERGGVPGNWLRACYAMHALTGEREYLDQVLRYWQAPEARRDLSLMIFHTRYEPEDAAALGPIIEEEIEALKPEVMANEPGGSLRDERWAVKMALASVYTGDTKYLDAALEWERGWRRMQYRRVGDGPWHYYFSRATNTYVSQYAYRYVEAEGITGHFISDHFRGPLVDLVVIKRLGDSTWGLVGRNLLLLGWMLPEPPALDR